MAFTSLNLLSLNMLFFNNKLAPL